MRSSTRRNGSLSDALCKVRISSSRRWLDILPSIRWSIRCIRQAYVEEYPEICDHWGHCRQRVSLKIWNIVQQHHKGRCHTPAEGQSVWQSTIVNQGIPQACSWSALNQRIRSRSSMPVSKKSIILWSVVVLGIPATTCESEICNVPFHKLRQHDHSSSSKPPDHCIDEMSLMITTNRTNLKTIQWNASRSRNFKNLKFFSVIFSPSMVLLIETHWIETSPPKFSSYNVIKNNCHERNGGGVAILVHNSTKFSLLPSKFFKFHLNGCNLYIFVYIFSLNFVYAPKDNSTKEEILCFFFTH